MGEVVELVAVLGEQLGDLGVCLIDETMDLLVEELPHVGRGRPRWRWIGHVPGVDLVEAAEVLDVGVEDRRLDHVVHGRPSGAEHSGEVAQCLLGLGFDPIRDRAGRGVDPRHPGAEDQAARDDRLAIGPERIGGLIARYCRSGHRPLLCWWIAWLSAPLPARVAAVSSPDGRSGRCSRWGSARGSPGAQAPPPRTVRRAPPR